MTVPTPKRDPSRRRVLTGSTVQRKSVLELARIYVSSASFGAALEALERLPQNGWDEDARLLRAESLVGLGRLADAEDLLGPPVLPDTDKTGSKSWTAKRRQAQTEQVQSPNPTGPIIPKLNESRQPLQRRERMAYWRFLLQLRILHRTGRYRQVLEMGRVFFGRRQLGSNILVARIATIMAQSMLALRRPAEARDLYENVLDLYKSLHSKEGVADALFGVANTHLLDCHWDESDALYQECRFRYEDLGQTDKALASTINLGVLRVKRGEFTSGRSLLQQALSRAEQLGDRRRTPSIRLGLAMVENRVGDFVAARKHILAAIRQARQSGNRRSQALGIEFLGELYLFDGKLDRAESTLALGLKLGRKLSPTGDIVFEIRRRQAELAVQKGNLEEARVLALESVRGAQNFGDAYEAATAERVLAEVEEAEGELETAMIRIAAVADTLDRLGETFERSRLEVLRLRVGHGLGKIPADSVRTRVAEIRRRWESNPESPVLKEACRLEGGISDHAPVFSIEEVAQVRTNVDIHRFEEGLSSEDERMIRAVGLATTNADLLQTLVLARKVAALPVSVLIHGEPGSGRERLARLIHSWSGRNGVYIPFHCAELSGELLEAELFGAKENDGRGGLLGASDGGTLFLDDVGDLPILVQNRLLEWLRRGDEGAAIVRPITNLQRVPKVPMPVRDLGELPDARIISATSRGRYDASMAGDHAAGRLQGDLHYQLARVVLEVPPLRFRPEDIPTQVEVLLDQARQRYGRDVPSLPMELMDEFLKHPWRENLRELRQAVDRYVSQWQLETSGQQCIVPTRGVIPDRDSISEAARALGVSKSDLYRLASEQHRNRGPYIEGRADSVE